MDMLGVAEQALASLPLVAIVVWRLESRMNDLGRRVDALESTVRRDSMPPAGNGPQRRSPDRGRR